MSTIKITDDEFDAYEPINNPFQEGQQLFETYGEELDYVLEHIKEHGEQYVWTQLDGDDGGVYIVNGYHLVNRIGYYITEHPHNLEEYLELCVIEGQEDSDE